MNMAESGIREGCVFVEAILSHVGGRSLGTGVGMWMWCGVCGGKGRGGLGMDVWMRFWLIAWGGGGRAYVRRMALVR